MTKDDFEAWVEHPVTQWVFRAARQATMLQKEEWDRRSWDRGEADPLVLAELRARADAYVAIAETSYEKMCELNGEEES